MVSQQESIVSGKITKGGLKAFGDAKENGINIRFTHVVLWRNSYDPTGNETAIENDDTIAKVQIADAKWSGDLLNITADINILDDFDIGSIGVVVNDNILFSVISHSGQVLARKVKTEELLLSFDLHILDLPKDLIEIKGPGQRLNLSISTELSEITSFLMKHSQAIMAIKEEISNINKQITELKNA